MMKLIFLALLMGSSANAGVAKLNWTHNNQAVDGSIVTLTQFRVYWGIQGQPITNIINLGPPAPLPWRVVGGVGTYSRTLDNTAWTPGATVCFQMTAFSSLEESGRSNTVCRQMPQAPSQPVIINIDTP